jgi:glycine cleavage system H protein
MSATIHYKRSRFSTRLPSDFLYSPAHTWVAREEAGEATWRVGLTKFATRMLGEMVDHGWEVEAEAAVAPGQIIGWVEGFKAMSDVYCVLEGSFLGGNPILGEDINRIGRDPYGEGWLYRAMGRPDDNMMEVSAYVALLDQTIDRILAQEHGEEPK